MAEKRREAVVDSASSSLVETGDSAKDTSSLISRRGRRHMKMSRRGIATLAEARNGDLETMSVKVGAADEVPCC